MLLPDANSLNIEMFASGSFKHQCIYRRPLTPCIKIFKLVSIYKFTTLFSLLLWIAASITFITFIPSVAETGTALLFLKAW